MGLGILPPPGVAPVKAPVVQDFTSSGTWTKPDDGWVLGICEMIGGGQGGIPQGGLTNAGDGGKYMRFAFLPSQVGATESVTVGAGSLGSSSSSSAPAVGGNSSFGSFPMKGYGGGTSPKTNEFSALFGAGNGALFYGDAGTVGGPGAATYGYLQAGSGGNGRALGLPHDGVAPGGGGGSQSPGYNGANGAVRITLRYA